MKVEILKWPSDQDWMMVKRAALVTVGKTPVTKPDTRWKHEILEARHSPVRLLQIVFSIEDIPYWTSTELSRHNVGVDKFIRSQRNDRQAEYDRNAARQDAPVRMIMAFNGESIQIVANKRLCNLATKEARGAVSDMCLLLEEKCPEFHGLLVPMCVYHGRKCHEMYGCGFCRPADPMDWSTSD